MEYQYLPEVVQTAIDDFKAAQDRYSSHGAMDTEPDYVFHACLRDILEGKLDACPVLSAEQWDLYTATMRCGHVARVLNLKLKKIFDLMAPAVAAAKILRETAWRASDV